MKYPCPFSLNSHVLITCGLSAHRLSLADEPLKRVEREFLICADNGNDINALAALLIAVSMDSLDNHVTQKIYSVMPGSGAVLSRGNPIFEHLFLSKPLGFPEGFGNCENSSSSLEIIQIIPLSERERRVVSTEGRQVLEKRLAGDLENLLRFDWRTECV
nr:suppressor of fused domain protein [Massilia sp. YIM B02443]